MVFLLVGVALVTVNGVPTVIGLVTPYSEGIFDGLGRLAAGLLIVGLVTAASVMHVDWLAARANEIFLLQLPLTMGITAVILTSVLSYEIRQPGFGALGNLAEMVMMLLVFLSGVVAAALVVMGGTWLYFSGVRRSDTSTMLDASIGELRRGEFLAERYWEITWSSTAITAATLSFVAAIPVYLISRRLRATYWRWRRA